jgi:regulator of sigma D
MTLGSLAHRVRDGRKPGRSRMTKAADKPDNARATTRKLIDDMLRERQQMLVLLLELTKLDPQHLDDPSRELVDEFLSILVDYIAAGHFGLYQRIVEGKERRSRVVETARGIYSRIAQSTEAAVAFSERFEHANDETLSSHLAAELSVLAEHITTRIELEDQLITAMLGDAVPLGAVARH